MTNRELVNQLVKLGHLKTQRIIEAFLKIDRRDFVLKEHEDCAYDNRPCPIGFGQSISQPLTVAFMFELLQPEPGQKVLDIGAGSGWQTALLAHIVGQAKDGGKPGKVIAIERIPELKQMAEENISKYNFIKKKIVEVVLGDGSEGYKKSAPYERIIAAASAETTRVAWKEQLRVGGRIVAPVKNTIEQLDKLTDGDFNFISYSGFTFVPLIIKG